MAHITGGGITDNLPRILPAGTAARIERGSWPVLPIFNFLQQAGRIDEAEMYRTFNMGIGLMLVVSEHDLSHVKHHLASLGEPCYEVGRIVSGGGAVQYA